MKAQGILAGNFYWYNNNWHYISKWDHLKNTSFLNSQSKEITQTLQELATKSFEASDAVMGRCISTSISLGWTEEQVKDKGEKMVAAIKKALATLSVTA
jgi:8-amino-3,8-dideoxy-alpha-D-manno-octulosonate transaminase